MLFYMCVNNITNIPKQSKMKLRECILKKNCICVVFTDDTHAYDLNNAISIAFGGSDGHKVKALELTNSIMKSDTRARRMFPLLDVCDFVEKTEMDKLCRHSLVFSKCVRCARRKHRRLKRYGTINNLNDFIHNLEGIMEEMENSDKQVVSQCTVLRDLGIYPVSPAQSPRRL